MLGVLVVATFGMGTWYLSLSDPRKRPLSPGIALLVAISLGMFLFYFVPAMCRASPSVIKVTDHYLSTVRGNRVRSVYWKDISSIVFTTRNGFRILRLRLTNGREREFGIDAAVSPEEVRKFLNSRGVSTTGRN